MAYADAYLFSRGPDGAVGNTLWRYDTLDAAATLDSAAYFTGNAVIKLRVGDVIQRVTWATAIGTGGTISTYGWHIVNANDGTTVDVTDSTVGLVTDTD